MKTIFQLLCLFAFIATSACATRYDQSGAPIAMFDLTIDAETAQVIAPSLNPSRAAPGNTHARANNPVRAITLVAHVLADEGTDADRRANGLIPLLFYASDAACDDYFAVLNSSRNVTVTAFDLASIASMGTAAVAGDANEWAGASGAFGAARRSLENNLLSQTQVPLLYAAVRQARVERRAAIMNIEGMASMSGQQRLQRVAAEFGDYHAMCGVGFGIQQVSRMISQSSEEPDDQ
jgi:hypothetical protein